MQTVKAVSVALTFAMAHAAVTAAAPPGTPSEPWTLGLSSMPAACLSTCAAEPRKCDAGERKRKGAGDRSDRQ